MFKFLKTKKKKKNIEVLKLEYDLLFKILIFLNAFFILYIAKYRDLSYQDLIIWKGWDWLLFIITMGLFVVDLWIFTLWANKFKELRDELLKKK